MDVSERVFAILDGKNSRSEIDIEGETAGAHRSRGTALIAIHTMTVKCAV